MLDSNVGLMFWTHSALGVSSSSSSSSSGSSSNSINSNHIGTGAGALIERASLDGSARRRLMAPQNSWPHGLTLDLNAKHIYFADANQRRIERINYDGLDRKVMLASEDGILRKPYALTVHDRHLYWTDFELRVVRRMSLDRLNNHLATSPTTAFFGGASSINNANEMPSTSTSTKSTGASTATVAVQTLLSGLENLMDIQMFYDRPNDSIAIRNCSHLNCSQLCILRESAPFAQCRCATGLELQPNQRDCAGDMSQFLLLAKRRMISRVSLDVDYYAEVAMRLPMQPVNLSNVITLDADVISKRVYWSDTALKVIYSGVYGATDSSFLNLKSNKDTDHSSRRPVSTGKSSKKRTKGGAGRTTKTGGQTRYRPVTSSFSSASFSKSFTSNASSASDQTQPQFGIDGQRVDTMVVHRVGLQDVNGLAVDSIGRKLYWTDAIRKRIEVSHLDGRHRKILIYQDLDSPRAITLNHRTGYMFWADWGNSNANSAAKKDDSHRSAKNGATSSASASTGPAVRPSGSVRIERADMDGSRRLILVNSNLGWPNGLCTFDASSEDKQIEDIKLLWVDSKTHSLEMVDLDGSNRRALLKELHSPYGIAAHRQRIFWTDWSTRAVHAINVTVSRAGWLTVQGQAQTLLGGLNNIADVRLIDARPSAVSSWPDSLDHLSNTWTSAEMSHRSHCHAAACSHLCLRNSMGASCACPTGVQLNLDRKTCQSSKLIKILIHLFKCRINHFFAFLSPYYSLVLQI